MPWPVRQDTAAAVLTWAAVTPAYENARRAPFILAAGITSGVIYAALAALPDLRRALTLYLVLHAVLAVLMLLTWTRLRRQAGAMGIVLVGALLFRLVAALGAPTLSDDVYRFVWDGRVQLSGHHPYTHAPVSGMSRPRTWTWLMAFSSTSRTPT